MIKVNWKGVVFTGILINMVARDQIYGKLLNGSLGNGVSLNTFMELDKMNQEVGYKMVWKSER